MSKGKKCKLEHPDILELCNVVPKEVINLREFIIDLCYLNVLFLIDCKPDYKLVLFVSNPVCTKS